MIKKTACLFILSLAFILLSGCETASAVKSGDITMHDVGRMAKTGTGNITLHTEKLGIVSEKIKRADDWVKDILW